MGNRRSPARLAQDRHLYPPRLPERLASTAEWLESPLPPPGVPAAANGWNETTAYFRRCREAAAAAGVELPVWDPAVEARIATQLASMLVADYRWLMTLDRDGTPVLRGVTRGTHLVDVNDPDAVRQFIRLHLPVEQLLAVAAEAIDRARSSTAPALNKDLTK